MLLRKIKAYIRYLLNKCSYIKGKKNHITQNGIRINTTIQIKGNNNTILFEDRSRLIDCIISIVGSNNEIIIKRQTDIERAVLLIGGNNCKIIIGSHTHIGASHLAVTEDNQLLTIGDVCMISDEVQFRTGDSHSIIDENGNRTNYAQSISIGDHVWIGEGCKVLKGVSIGNNSIVGTGAIVTKSFGNNLLLGGVPAKVLKERINWNSQR